MPAYLLTLTLALAAAPAQEAAGSPARAAALAAADCARLSVDDQPYVRYLWLPTAAAGRADFLCVLHFHCNLLSDQGTVASFVHVAADLVRLDTREYGWDARPDVWERLAKLDPYFHAQAKLLEDKAIALHWPGGKDGQGKEFGRKVYAIKRKAGDLVTVPSPWLPAKEIDTLRALTYSEAPLLNAEWFFVQTARQISIRNKDEKVGYYEWLGLRHRDDFFRLTGTDVKLAERVFAEWRAVVDRSGVSQQNRQIIRYGNASRSVRGTLDTFSQEGRGQAKRNLRRGEFAHDAEEWIGFLPNGLPVFLLTNKDGAAQASAPDQIGPDDSALRVGRDARVHACLSCLRCHGVDKDMVKPVDDWARRTFRQGGVLRLADKDKKVTLELQSLYLRDLNELLDDDRVAYARNLRRATGKTWPAMTKLYGGTWNRLVEDQLTLGDAAREIGTTGRHLLASIERHEKVRGGTDLILAGFLDRPAQRISRLEWEDTIGLAAALAAGVQPPEIVKEEKQK